MNACLGLVKVGKGNKSFEFNVGALSLLGMRGCCIINYFILFMEFYIALRTFSLLLRLEEN